MKELTEKQAEVLRFVVEYRAAHGYPPTNREIAVQFLITPKAAHDHVLALSKKDAVRIKGHSSRSIEVIRNDEDCPPDFLNIPIVGDIAAGMPIMSEENIDGWLRLSESMLKKGAVYFAMRVHGESMIGAGILSGDLALIEKKDYADNGEIVVADIGEKFTLKRFFREHSRIKLQAENPAYKPIYTTNACIAGVLAMIIRSY
ncbi:MAG: transcriptional repressor LexA [Spirochaetaceae bacterium]|jgi:repressor LexA|nr:transcriptional repressor LexA [Spirochaetaceae bacterium]